MAWDPAVIAAVGGAVGAILAGIPGVISALSAARKANEAIAKVENVGKQVGQHVYEVRDRMNTESARGEAIQRQVETLVAKSPPERISEQSVSSYVRKAKAAQSAAEDAARQAKEMLAAAQMMLGQTPTDAMKTMPHTPSFTGKVPLPPPVGPLKDEDD